MAIVFKFFVGHYEIASSSGDLVDMPTSDGLCVELLWPSQPNGVMSSAASLPNQKIFHDLSP